MLKVIKRKQKQKEDHARFNKSNIAGSSCMLKQTTAEKTAMAEVQKQEAIMRLLILQL